MPDAAGNFKGQGWSQKRSDGWERVFGRPVPQCHDIAATTFCELCAPRRDAESSRENQNRDNREDNP